MKIQSVELTVSAVRESQYPTDNKLVHRQPLEKHKLLTFI